MAALVVLALFSGNCFSCPQILLAAHTHSCCPHGKADPGECKTQALRSFVKAEQSAPIAPAPVVRAAVQAELAALPLIAPVVVSAPALYTAPDSLPLRI
jgi:hypothetical protein